MRSLNVSRVTSLIAALVVAGCSETRNLGSTVPQGLLPVDERNPILLANDDVYDNWQGEYAVLLANGGGPSLAGIIVNSSAAWPDIDANVAGWRALVEAARASGLRNIPDPITSIGPVLARPADGQIASTVPNRSEWRPPHLGHVDKSQPAVQAAGGRDRHASDRRGRRLSDGPDGRRADRGRRIRFGSIASSGAEMSKPNGEMDPWADAIVAASFRFVQVSAFYDQLTDVPNSQLSQLPANSFGSWISAKAQPKIWDLPQAGDQVAVMAVGIPSFAVAVERVSVAATLGADAGAGPDLVANPSGPAWLVTQSASAGATKRFWQILTNPATYSP